MSESQSQSGVPVVQVRTHLKLVELGEGYKVYIGNDCVAVFAEPYPAHYLAERIEAALTTALTTALQGEN